MRSTLNSFVVAAIAMGVLSNATSAAAAPTTYCDETLPAGEYQNVVVPQGATCVTDPGPILIRGNVTVLEEGSFVSYSPSELTVRGNVLGRAQSTIDIEGQTVRGNVLSNKGLLLINNSRIDGNVESHEGTRANVNSSLVTHGSIRFDGIDGPEAEAWAVGNVVERGDISITRSTMSPLCPSAPPWCLDVESNTLYKGDIRISRNVIPADVEMLVFDNRVRGMQVRRNIGPGAKEVSFNLVEGTVMCKRNDDPFFGGPNYSSNPRPSHGDNQCSTELGPPPEE